METTKERLLENIISIRQKRGFSQEYVATKLGKKQSGYALIESGNRGLEYETLLQLAIIFDMRVIDIITYPEVYNKGNSTSTKVLVELEVTPDEFIQMGLKDKIVRVLEK